MMLDVCGNETTSGRLNDHKCLRITSTGSHPDVSGEEGVHLEVRVVLAEGPLDRLCHLQPANEENQLEDGEEGKVEIHLFLVHPDVLGGDQRQREVYVDGAGHDLHEANKLGLRRGSGDSVSIKESANFELMSRIVKFTLML